MTAAEIVPAGEYTRLDFASDLDAVLKAVQAREAVLARLRTWDETNTLDLARRLVRMRASDHWRGPGMKHNDREFYEWLMAEGVVNSRSWAQEVLQAGRALPALEQAAKKNAITYLPVGAAQIKRLGGDWYTERPEAIANVWQAAVDESDGQPRAELVASKARRYKALVQSVEEPARRTGPGTTDRKLAKLCDDILAMAADRPAATVEWLATVTAKVNKLVGII